MRAAWYDRTGPAREVLTLGDLPTPDPGPGEVLVRVAASGVNPSDWKARAGNRSMPFPRIIPHSDGAGTVEAVGEGVDRARIGKRVWLWNAAWKRPFGTAAELVALPAAQAVPLPDATTFEAGACLGIPALTAWRALDTDGGVAGKSVLVAGGAGSVGRYAVQMAKLMGASAVIATVSSAAKAEHAQAAGADVTVDYRTEDVIARVRDLTSGRGVDRVVEVDLAANAPLLGGLIAPDGLCACYGSGKPEVALPFFSMIVSGAAVRFFIVYELSADARARGVAQVNGWLEDGALSHDVAAVMPLTEIAAAHDAVEGGRTTGNVVLSV